MASRAEWASRFVETAERGHCGMASSNTGDCKLDDRGSIDLSRIWSNADEGFTYHDCKQRLASGLDDSDERGDGDLANRLYEEAVAPQNSLRQPRCWRAAVSACVRHCIACDKCRFVSLSIENNDCSWFSFCNFETDIKRDVAGFLTGRVGPDYFTCRAPSPPSPALAPLVAVRAMRPTPIRTPGLRCDERYMHHVSCAGRTFLFSRRDREPNELVPGEHKYARWETMMHTSGHSYRKDAGERLSTNAGSTLTAFHPRVQSALPNSMNMSHNAALLCLGGTLVALGGQAYQDSRAERGIMRRDADPTVLPLRWSAPQLVLSGEPTTTGCVEARCVTSEREVFWHDEADKCPFPRRDQRMHCEYDGKLSVVRFQGELLLFSRSNPYAEGGGRHVQVSRSPLGPDERSPLELGRYSQLVFDGYTMAPENNIYLISVRAVGTGLLGLYPAVIDNRAGVYCSASSDGVHWSSPTRVVWSAVLYGSRSKDWPVDVYTSEASPSNAAAVHSAGIGGVTRTSPSHLDIVIEHDVHISLGGPDYFKTLCVNATKPRLCSYRLKLKHGESASHQMCLRMAEELRAHEFAERKHSEGMAHLSRILSNGGVSGEQAGAHYRRIF